MSAIPFNFYRPTIEDEVARRGIKLRRAARNEFEGPCPICSGTNRFSINIRKQLWNCRGCQRGGDVIDLVQHIDGCDFKSAMRILGIEAGERPQETPIHKPTEAPPPRRDEDANGKRALAIWEAAKPISRTLAETYLRSRGIDPEDLDGNALRFHPSCPFGGIVRPCMIALFRAIEGNKPVAIHRTALTPEGKKIDRMTLGPISGAAIKLSSDEEVHEGLHIGEGIESTMAAMALGFKPAWALGHAGGIAKFPVLAGIESLTIIVDNDAPDRRGRRAGHESASECGQRWMEAGREVLNVIPRAVGTDMADVLAESEASCAL
jgi:CHC2 zinc finger/Toprim domain